MLHHCAKTDHGGHHRPTVAMGTNPLRQCIHQSANILCNKSTSLEIEKIFIYGYQTI